MKQIGFIGVGVMGKSMVRNLVSHGFDVSIYTRTKSKAEDLLNEGVRWCGSAGECAKDKDAVITMVGFPKDVEEVYFGDNGVMANAKKGAYLIDMTTTDPALSERIYDTGAKKGLYALDAPVSGGDSGAKNGTLSIMVGGDKDAFDACLPLFKAMGTNIVYQGGAGCGQHTKMANQIALGGALAGVCEAITYAKASGLDVGTMLESIEKGAAGSWQMSNMAPKILGGDFDPGFFVKHYIKDMRIAKKRGEEQGCALPILNEVLSLYERLAQDGYEDLGTQVLIKAYEKDE